MKRLNLLFLALGLAACHTVPFTGRHQLLLVSADQEKQLGLTEYEKFLGSAKLSSDTQKVGMIRRVGQRLAAAANRPDYKWEFNLIEDDKTVNAWCLPGGKVAVYTGLLPVAQDENGVAVVMGHEISHALARHGSERMSQGLLAQFGGAALSVLMANEPGAAQRLYAQAYGLGVNVGILLPFSRGQESEADHIGLILMAEAGYDPHGAVGFWQRMMKVSKGGQGPLDKYLSTHPPDNERVKKIREELPEALHYYHPS